MGGAADQALLAALPAWSFGFVLVLARAGAAVMLMPGLGEAETPMMVRAGFAAALSFLLLPAIQPLLPPMPGSIWPLVAMVCAELLAGALLGWLARLILLALPVAGQILSYMVGLSNVLQPDPGFGGQGTVLGRLFSLAAPALILATGLHALPIAALAGSYRVIPPGSLMPVGDGVETAVAAVAESFGLALRLAAPFVLAGVIWQAGLGLLARLVPNLQVFFVVQPAQILGGVALLALLSLALLQAWGEAARTGLSALPGL